MANQPITQDTRFQSIQSDPRFIRPKKKKTTQPAQDDRFEPLTREDRPKKTKAKTKSTSQIPTIVDYARARVILESSDEEDQNVSLDSASEESESDDQVVQLGPRSGSSRKDHHPLEINLDENMLEDQPQPDEQTTPQIEPTKRIAIVNLDWDHLKPIDIYKVFCSLLSPDHHHKNPSDLQQLPSPSDNDDDDHTSKKKPINSHNVIIKGRVLRVRFYKSQFGKERMKVEDIEGPPKEIFKRPSRKPTSNDPEEEEHDDDDDDDDEEDGWVGNEDEGNEFDEEALRKYQLDRLRYFYAIVELDSVRSAHHVFTQIDGTEFERTANIFDLSYVPDNMNFDEDDLWDECVEDSNDYKGVDFSTDVLRHSKVKLTWDSEDPIRSRYTRLNTQKLKQEELDSMDFRNFIAPPSSGEEEEEEEDGGRADSLIKNKARNLESSDSSRSKNMRQLLGLTSDSQTHQPGDDQDNSEPERGDEDLNITFKPGFIDLNHQDLDESKTEIKSTKFKSRNQKIKQKLKSKSVDDQSLILNQNNDEQDEDGKPEKKDKKNKKKDALNAQDRQELELLMMDEGGNGSQEETKDHFDLNQIIKSEKNKKKKKKKHQKSASCDDHEACVDRFSIDANDSRFDMLVHHPEFAIDPSNPQFKKTKNMMDLLDSTRHKRRLTDPSEPSQQHAPTDSTPTPTDPSLKNTRILLDHVKKSSLLHPAPKRSKLI